jgi:hypothetical protein
MIVDIEQLKKMRTAVGLKYAGSSNDDVWSEPLREARELLDEVIKDIEMCGESIIELEGR